MRGFAIGVALAVACWGWDARADCPPGSEFCFDGGADGSKDGPPGGGGPSPCWDPELKKDLCNEPPDPCPPETAPTFQFLDDQDGADDGQLVALGEGETEACGTLTVDKTGYFKIFDIELSESCDKQLDESGYLTVHNSCNPDGWAVQANSGDRYIVLDSDNTPPCSSDGECGAGKVCRDGTNGGQCCVPADPTFMGTFLLVAGEKNKICLHHWCPEWKAAKAQGKDLGFVTAGCEGSINSIHFRIDTNAVACEEDTTLKPCTWGCEDGVCLPDPCETANCPAYCKDGVCLDSNPCDGLDCKHGCKNGRCLQAPSAPGTDGDGDGYPATADCDDGDASVNPGAGEVCGNGQDDDCDGAIDEADCGAPPPGAGGGPGGDDGCGCRVNNAGSPLVLLLLAVWLLTMLRRRATRRGL